MGSAYIGLASISIVVDLPQKVVNCFAIGAVLFAIADLIQSFDYLRANIKKVNEKTENKLEKGLNSDIGTLQGKKEITNDKTNSKQSPTKPKNARKNRKRRR